MTRFERLNFSSRAFCVAAILGLSLAVFDTQAVRASILLAAVSATATAADLTSRLSSTWIALAESVSASLLIGVAMPEGLALLPYLVIPALIVGLRDGVRPVLAVVGIESAALGSVALTAAGTERDLLASSLLPWLVTSLGVGLLCAWLRELGIGTSRPP